MEKKMNKEETYEVKSKEKLYRDTIDLFGTIVKSDRVKEDTVVLNFDKDNGAPTLRGKYLNQNGETVYRDFWFNGAEWEDFEYTKDRK